MSAELRRFVLRRLGGGLLAVVGAALLVFFVRHLVPGDPVDVLAGGEAADPRDKEEVRKCLDLDKPLGGQLVAFARDYLRVKYVFWCTEEPFYTRDVLPYLMMSK